MEKKRNTMRKVLGLLLCLVLVLSLAACGGSSGGTPDPEPVPDDTSDFVWTREGYFEDEEENLLSISPSDMEDYPGWYVGGFFGQDIYGWYIPQEGRTLHGNLVADYLEGEDPFIVTVTEEGEDGVLLEVEGGKSYHFKPVELPEATIIVSVNVEGMGGVDYNQGEEPPVFDPDRPYQSAQLNLAEPQTFTLLATSYLDGWRFVKWTKDGEDFSSDACITVELTESADFIAVFEPVE